MEDILEILRGFIPMSPVRVAVGRNIKNVAENNRMRGSHMVVIAPQLFLR